MQITYFLSQLFGLFLLIKGLFLLIRVDLVKAVLKDADSNKAITHFLGTVMTIFGLILTMVHNFWGNSIEISVSVFSWTLLFLGIVIIFAPVPIFKSLIKVTSTESDLRSFVIIMLIIALYFIYKGFGF